MARLVLALLAAAALAGCSGAVAADPHKLQVVAAENFWGSLAAQLGGDRVQVTSIVHEPATDPHDYEPTAADARRMAVAKMAIVNGVGYDSWAPKLLDASPVDGRVVLTVGKLVGVGDGGNPHRWYSPADVQRVIDAITAAYKRLEPRHASYFDARRAQLETRGLARYRALIAAIRQRFGGTPVGASESVFAPLAQGLGLRLLTPSGLLNAVSEGSEPTAADRTTADRQIRSRQIRLWVYNSQNSTPDVQRLTSEARAAGIPVATVTETLAPASASFEQWQSGQLQEIERALAR
jgi:zinc/manganese transport system substrate-binding protein